MNRLAGALVALAMFVGLATSAAAQGTTVLDGNPKNGLSSRSFLRNALTLNPTALSVMLQQRLDNTLLQHPLIRYQLNDKAARAVMAEIVKCALGPDTELTHSAGTSTWQWRGELGLCQGQTETGNWNAAPPTVACQELVTACVMARVNALGKSVPLSLRGAPAELFPLSDAVRVEKRRRERDGDEDPAQGTLIDSFSSLCPPGQECKWAPAYVGQCTGGQVSIAIKSAALCTSTPVRVCAGIHGCYGPGSPVGYPSEVPYSEHLVDSSGACTGSTLQFACPIEAQFGGYYSVMTRPVSSGREIPASPQVVKVSGNGSFPASESQVFTFREGAFYGNMFTPAGLTVHCQVSPSNPAILLCGPANGAQTPFPCATACPAPVVANWNLYACYSMNDGANPSVITAYLNDRVCATTNGTPCFLSQPQRCAARCQWDNARGVFANCRGIPDASGVEPAYRPITTYLNAPCDLLGSPEVCSRVSSSLQ